MRGNKRNSTNHPPCNNPTTPHPLLPSTNNIPSTSIQRSINVVPPQPAAQRQMRRVRVVGEGV